MLAYFPVEWDIDLVAGHLRTVCPPTFFADIPRT
jgi:hypothetical protein